MNKTIEILMVEDIPGDIRLSKEYLREHKVPNNLRVVKDVADAVSLLYGRDESALVAFPDIILISIRMLWQHNYNLLKQIKCDATLANIPIVILTAFEGEEVSLDGDLADNLCVSKPLNFDSWSSITKLMGF